MKRQLLLSAAICAVSVPLAARQLTPQEALDRVNRSNKTYISVLAAASGGQTELVYTLGDDDINTLYVFNRGGAGGGFLVVSADDAAPALLGYASSGAFNAADIPVNMTWWLNQYSSQIAMAAGGRLGTADADYEYPEMASIEPIVKTYWNQGEPYNEQCPEVSGTRCPTGCVATAMAQAMNVFQWPEKGTGSHSYTPYDVGEQLTVDFSSITYQWDKMLDRYAAGSPQENIDAVATLMYSCGVSISMQYHPKSSGGNYTNAAKALVNYFNYDKGLRIAGRDYYGIKEWVDMIYGELEKGHPVLYSGRNDEAGHAFVCDGYDTDGYFHINWGWGGTSNGYFLLTALNPSEQGIGGSASGYNIDQSILIGLQKPQANSCVVPVMQFISNFGTVDDSYPRLNSAVKFRDRRGIFNESVETVKATLGVRLTDGSGNETYVESTEKEYIPGQGFTNYEIPSSSFPDEGTYTVTPVVKDEQGKWWDCEVKLSNARALNLEITADSLLFTATEEPIVKATDVTLLSPIYPGKQCGISATLTNIGEMEFYDEVTPVLVSNGAEAGLATPISVNLVPGQSDTFEWIGEFSTTVAPGEYVLYLSDSNGTDLNRGLKVVVEEAPTEAVKYTLTVTSINGETSTEESPVEMAYDNVEVKVTVDCSAGYFTGILNGGVWQPGAKTGIMDVAGGYVGVKAGEQSSVEMHKDLSEYLNPGTVYYFQAYTKEDGYTGNKLYFTSGTAGINIIGTDKGELSLAVSPDADRLIVTAPYPIMKSDVYSITGLKVVSTNGDCGMEYSIDISGLASGIYILSVTTESGERLAAKFVRR